MAGLIKRVMRGITLQVEKGMVKCDVRDPETCVEAIYGCCGALGIKAEGNVTVGFGCPHLGKWADNALVAHSDAGPLVVVYPFNTDGHTT